MTSLPDRSEAAPYYFTYIDRVKSGDVVAEIERQMDEVLTWAAGICEEKSTYRYAPEKWSIRQVLNHVTDVERLAVFRAFWISRGFADALPSFEQDVAAAAAGADSFSWARHVEDFRATRLSTLSFFRVLPEEAWMKTGVASGNRFTLRAHAYIIAGHADHHLAILRDRYQ
jgi:hypothetical protein